MACQMVRQPAAVKIPESLCQWLPTRTQCLHVFDRRTYLIDTLWYIYILTYDHVVAHTFICTCWLVGVMMVNDGQWWLMMVNQWLVLWGPWLLWLSIQLGISSSRMVPTSLRSLRDGSARRPRWIFERWNLENQYIDSPRKYQELYDIYMVN